MPTRQSVWSAVAADAPHKPPNSGPGDRGRVLVQDQLASSLFRVNEPVRESVGTQLLRSIYHFRFHVGEAAAVRQLIGQGEFPGFVGDLSAATYRPEADEG